MWQIINKSTNKVMNEEPIAEFASAAEDRDFLINVYPDAEFIIQPYHEEKILQELIDQLKTPISVDWDLGIDNFSE